MKEMIMHQNKKQNSDPIWSLKPVSKLLQEQGISANKALGQHFLFDLNLTRKIVKHAKAEHADLIIEIGSGPGGLTRALLMETKAHLLCIEKDKRFYSVLNTLNKVSNQRISLIEEDALSCNELTHIKQILWNKTQKTDQELHCIKARSGSFQTLQSDLDKLKDLSANEIKIIANLPYNISVPLCLKWIKASPLWWQEAILMFQKEVANRINALPGNKTYGRLSILVQSMCTVKHAFSIPASAFTPPPKIDSAILILKPKSSLLSKVQIKHLENLTFHAFNQRRKHLKTALKPILNHLDQSIESFLIQLDIDPKQRAEELSPEDYIRMTNYWIKLKTHT